MSKQNTQKFILSVLIVIELPANDLIMRIVNKLFKATLNFSRPTNKKNFIKNAKSNAFKSFFFLKKSNINNNDYEFEKEKKKSICAPSTLLLKPAVLSGKIKKCNLSHMALNY